MNTQTFETPIELAVGGGSASGTAATSDPTAIAVLLIACVLAASAAALAICARKGGALVSDGSTTVSSAIFRIAGPIAAIALALLLAVGMLLPSGSALAVAGRDVNASVPSKVTATVGADGSVAVAKGAISNSGDALAIGVRKVATASTADLGDATLKVSIGGAEVYCGPVGSDVTINNYATVAKGASSEMAFELSVPADKALALAGTSPVTVKTTVDVVCSPTGKLAYGGSGKPVAGAEATATYTDPYTGLARTYETTTDENGSYTLEPMMYGTKGTISFATGNGKTIEVPFTADEDQHIVDAELTDYLSFTAKTENSTVTPKFKAGTWEYSLDDGSTWTAGSNGGSTAIALAKIGDSVKLRGTGCTTDVYNHFSMAGSIAASGSVTSLTDGGGADPGVALANFCYYLMFQGCTSLASAPSLPATELAQGCYRDMFNGCTSLASAPALPATTLADYCYRFMFQGCTSLASAPALPATELADYCYEGMFQYCTSLASAPSLPATTLADYCYAYMFRDCTSLASAPSLSATTLADYCYTYMFQDCKSLATAPALPATVLVEGCYEGMFQNCTSLASAPSLPAETLAQRCYYFLFYGCSKLKVSETDDQSAANKILTCPSNIPKNAVTGMFKRTGGSFKDTPAAGKTYCWYTES